MRPELEELRAAARPPTPPSRLRGGIGPGDFWTEGWLSLDRLLEFTEASELRHVLDVGSGLGRFALPLSTVLPETSRYDGFDVAAAYVEWCQTGLGLDARFRFQHAAVRNSQYNPDGRKSSRWFRFPYPRGTFSHTVACSLYTHLTAPETKRYLRESARVLAPGGLFFGTFFLVDDDSQALLESGDTYPVFRHPVRHGYLVDRESPGDGVAFHRQWVERQLEKARLDLVDVVPGAWRTHTDGYYQDTVVARKPPA